LWVVNNCPISLQFLRAGRVGSFSEFRWPEAGVWVRVGDNIAACRTGIHACRTQDLPWWLADELWEIELEDEVQLEEHKVLARAGRLRTRIEGCLTHDGADIGTGARRSSRLVAVGESQMAWLSLSGVSIYGRCPARSFQLRRRCSREPVVGRTVSECRI
jgi:hypothetical protein